MKKFIHWAVCLGLCLALSVCAALAAEDDITVQLDGEALTFTDAVPQVRDQRTYLPFRAVFEAMGAEVDYEGQVITAVRGGKTLTMTVGSAEAAVEENGVTLPIQMDVAPYVDAATWRTYVPVRFAAQAFDCVVGWDQKTLTAIIIDTEKLAAAAKEGKSYTYLEKLVAMNEKYNTGLWDLTATFDGDASMFSASMLTASGTVKGAMEGSAQLDMTMHMTLNTDNVDFAIRGDLDCGKLYLNMDMGALGAKAGVEPGAWYEMDMPAAMKQNGDVLDALIASLTAAEPTNAATAYTDLKSNVDALCAAFADDSFFLWGSKVPYNFGFCTKDYDWTAADGTTCRLELNLHFVSETDHTLQDYTATFILTQNETTKTTITIKMTADGKVNAGVEMDMGGTVTVNMLMDGSFTSGTTAPVTAPPAGAKILPFDDLTKQGGGVIGGGDGPTVLVGSPA